MKNLVMKIGVIVLVAVIGFAIISCGGTDGGDDGNGSGIGSGSGKTVTVGAQDKMIMMGSSAGPTPGAGGDVSFPVTTANILGNVYTPIVANLPEGVTVAPNFGTANNSGILTLQVDSSIVQQQGTFSNLTLTIDGTTSNAFSLVISPYFGLSNGTITSYYGSAIVEIPASINGMAVTSIGDSALNGKEISSVTIPNSITTIGEYAFDQSKLTGIIIPDSVKNIGTCAFRGTEITTAIIGGGLTEIESSLFSGSKLTSIIIPDNITTIKDWAFQYNQLTSVTIGNGVTTIGLDAFRNNQLESIVIPENIITIEGGAFSENPLVSITIGADCNIDGGNPFPGNFNTAYNNSGKLAGTYTRSGVESTEWTKR